MNRKALYIFTMKQFNIESYFLENFEECFHKTIWFGSGLVWENGFVILIKKKKMEKLFDHADIYSFTKYLLSTHLY